MFALYSFSAAPVQSEIQRKVRETAPGQTVVQRQSLVAAALARAKPSGAHANSQSLTMQRQPPE
jgi:hypothetical protein